MDAADETLGEKTMAAQMKNNDLLKNILILIVVVIVAIVILSIALAILKMLAPLLVLGALVAGIGYLVRKIR